MMLAASRSIYIAELVPAPSRGFFTSADEVLSNAGMVAGFICQIMLSSAFPAQAALVTLLRINAIFSALLIISILTIPESPYWLLMNGNPDNRATEILENSKRNLTETNHIITAMQHILFVGITVTCCFLMMLGLPLLALQLNLIHVSDTINTAATGANNEIVVITVCLLGILGIVGSFDIALGPVTWVYTAEAFDYMSRTQGSCYAVVCNRIADTIYFFVNFSSRRVDKDRWSFSCFCSLDGWWVSFLYEVCY